MALDLEFWNFMRCNTRCQQSSGGRCWIIHGLYQRLLGTCGHSGLHLYRVWSCWGLVPRNTPVHLHCGGFSDASYVQVSNMLHWEFSCMSEFLCKVPAIMLAEAMVYFPVHLAVYSGFTCGKYSFVTNAAWFMCMTTHSLIKMRKLDAKPFDVCTSAWRKSNSSPVMGKGSQRVTWVKMIFLQIAEENFVQNSVQKPEWEIRKDKNVTASFVKCTLLVKARKVKKLDLCPVKPLP